MNTSRHTHRRPRLAVLAAVLAAPLLPGLTASTAAASEVRHFLDADQFGTKGNDEVNDVDAADDVVASVGVVRGSLPGHGWGGGTDAFLRLADGDLGERWTLQLGGAGDDSAAAVATDGERVLVGGTTEGGIGDAPLGGADGWLMLLDANGDPLQTRVLGGPDSDGVGAVALAEDGLFAAGWSGGRGIVWRYDAAGEEVWTADLTGSGAHILSLGDQVVVTEHLVDDQGEEGTRIVGLDAATGDRNWATSVSYGGPTGITTDGEHIFVTGWSIDFDDDRYIGVLRALDVDGARLWSTRIYGGDGFDYSARAVGWDGSAVVAVSGSDLVAFSPTGRRRWIEPLPAELQPAVATRGAGGLYVGGSTDGSVGNDDSAGGSDAVVGRFVLYQPDAQAGRISRPPVGDDLYSRRGQNLTVRIGRGREVAVELYAQNDGEVPQRLRLKGCGDHDGYDFRYVRDAENVTAAITTRGLRTPRLGPGGISVTRVFVSARRSAAPRASCAFTVGSISTGERDRVILRIRLR